MRETRSVIQRQKIIPDEQLHRQNHVLRQRRVTVVERDPDIISLFRALLLPHFPRPDALEIIQADAFDFAPKHLLEYDVVFTDLWHDVSDGLPLYQRMKALEVPGVKYLYWIEQTLRCYLR